MWCRERSQQTCLHSKNNQLICRKASGGMAMWQRLHAFLLLTVLSLVSLSSFLPVFDAVFAYCGKEINSVYNQNQATNLETYLPGRFLPLRAVAINPLLADTVDDRYCCDDICHPFQSIHSFLDKVLCRNKLRFSYAIKQNRMAMPDPGHTSCTLSLPLGLVSPPSWCLLSASCSISHPWWVAFILPK